MGSLMDTWIEERCEAIRLALRIAGFPELADLLRLVDWLGGIVQLRHTRGAGARVIHFKDGTKSITLPVRLGERPMCEQLAHEVGHVLLTAGMGSLLRQLAPGDAQVERLARRCEAQDERRARDFVLAWWLPSRLVERYPDDAELAEHASVTEAMVQLRRRQLGGRVIDITRELPRWSAGQHYHTVVTRMRSRALLQVLRFGSASPAFDLPTTHPACTSDALQVNADLVALTVAEFDRKYDLFRCGDPELQPVDLAQLQRWSGR